MSKYIDADRLKAEIERLYDIARDASYNGEIEGEMTAYDKILSLITSLQQEQPEVDLEKELGRWRHKHFKGKRDGDYSGEYLERESQLDLARHFYELGLNARKENIVI